jgi:L-ascorbate metabolism protein UlaG (beta-lactamase superfamily)
MTQLPSNLSRRQVCKLFRDAALAGAGVAMLGGGRALAAGGGADGGAKPPAPAAGAPDAPGKRVLTPATPRPAMTGPVRVRFLGTGAADHKWNQIGQPGVRGSCSTLLDGHVLIDCGTTGMSNLSRAGVEPRALTDIVFTHSHGDHFHHGEIKKVLDARGAGLPPPDIWASPPLIADLERKFSGRFVAHALVLGDIFATGRLSLTALPANHMIQDDPLRETEQPLHYLVRAPHGNLLYALDGAWMLNSERLLIGKTRLDMIVWDATVGQKPGAVQVFGHNDLDMIALMERALRKLGCMDENTVRVLDHTSLGLWPRDPKAARKLAEDGGWVLAEDGMELSLGT